METLDDEPDPLFYESSITRNGCYDQFVLFILDKAEIVYPPKEEPVWDNPETTGGGW